MKYSDIVFGETYGTSSVYSGTLLIDIANHVANNGYSGALWADNFKGRINLCATKPENLFARIHVQQTDEPDISQEWEEILNQSNERLIIVAWPSGKSKLYYPKSYETNMPYEGRQYLLNSSDCYRLAMDFYEREFGIQLNIYRADRSWLRASMTPREYNTMLREYVSNGFERVAMPQHGDGILINTTGLNHDPNHVAVYLEGDLILHHFVDRISCIQPYSSFWKERTSMILRHRSKL